MSAERQSGKKLKHLLNDFGGEEPKTKKHKIKNKWVYPSSSASYLRCEIPTPPNFSSYRSRSERKEKIRIIVRELSIMASSQSAIKALCELVWKDRRGRLLYCYLADYVYPVLWKWIWAGSVVVVVFV